MDVRELIEWQHALGADEALEHQPRNHLVAAAEPTPKPTQKPALQTTPAATPAAETNAKPLPASSPTPVGARTSTKPVGSTNDAVLQAQKAANEANSLEELRNAVETFDGCLIKKTATNTVFADGVPEARVMVIGEAPGASEDEQGIPFCGASGKLLDAMFAAIGLSRQKNLYISNTLFWRPPGNRRPTPEELAMCRPFVEKHIALINPSILVLVGGTATASLLDPRTGITKLRGHEHHYHNEYLEQPIATFAIFHPSYLLRQPLQERLAWQDLLHISTYLEKNFSGVS
ncbi:MAG: uracil-DNA glycosylase [Rickettsiales bacterium]|nr:uracil-DNA glycosylase [Rickettsiales bacterium]